MADRSASEVVAKLRPIDDLMFSMIGRYRPEILEEFLRLILDDNSMEFNFYFSLQWNFNHFGMSNWYIERM